MPWWAWLVTGCGFFWLVSIASSLSDIATAMKDMTKLWKSWDERGRNEAGDAG